MAFRATNQLTSDAYRQCKIVASQQKVYFQRWSSELNSNLNALTALEWVANLNRTNTIFNQTAAMPGIEEQAKTIESDPTYNVVAEFTSMFNAQNAVLSWLTTNIPANAISVVNGVATGSVYPPAATVGLKGLINAAAATIV